VEELRHIDGVEGILAIAEVAGDCHVCISSMIESTSDGRGDQHASDALARAAAGKARRQRRLRVELLLSVEPPHQNFRCKAQQFIPVERAAQHRGPIPGILVRDYLCAAVVRQPLQQQSGTDVVIRRQHELGVELLGLSHVVSSTSAMVSPSSGTMP